MRAARTSAPAAARRVAWCVAWCAAATAAGAAQDEHSPMGLREARPAASRSFSPPPPPPPPPATPGLDVPGTRIYRSVSSDGRVVYSDAPQDGARAVQIRSFASSSDAEAVATARRHQDYWRSQADAFERRRQERATQEARERAQRERAEAEPLVVVVPRYLRPPAGVAYPGPMAPLGGIPSAYASSPGVGAPAAFIGSGFSTAR